MTAPTFALLALSLAASSWQANVLSDDPAVRASELAHFRAKGRAGLYALQDLVNRAADPAERARAIRALGELGNPDAEWALYLELKQSTPGVAAAAIRAVTALRLVKLQSAVAAHVGDPNENLTAALGESAELFPKVIEAARSRLVEPRPEAQLAALRIFAAAHAAVPESDARRLLASPRPEISLLAAEALAATDAAAAEAVEAKLAAGPDPLGSRAAFDLAKLGTPEASEALEALARTPACPERAVTALASTAGALPVLISLRANESSLRPLIDRTLSRHPPAVAVLLAVAGGSDDGMAAAAVA
ncbi:MAG TPA: hypothetical protein VMB50_24880, partial [Myxococcales bacterium]|nr:hypothetical protein [Myxococcales bacterium]